MDDPKYLISFKNEIEMLYAKKLNHPSLGNIIGFEENGVYTHKDGRTEK